MEGFWVIVILYLVVTAIGAVRKRQKAAGTGAPARGGTGDPARMSVLQRALAELKRAEEAARRRQLEEQQVVGYPKPEPTRGLEDDDADETSEGEEEAESYEVVSLDEEAERAAEAHKRPEVRVEREDVSLELLSAAQTARRAAREEAAPVGGRVEHRAWHEKMAGTGARAHGGTEEPTHRARTHPLARFGGRSARDAVVLGEILGRPLADRS